MKTLSTLTLGLLGALVVGTPTVLADYIVASNLSDSQLTTFSWNSVGLVGPPTNATDIGVGQSFVAPSSGALTTVDALVASGQIVSGSPPLTVSIYTSSNGIAATELATLSFQQSDFASLTSSQIHRKTFDFSQSHILLEGGEEYSVAFETPFSVSGRINSPYYVGWSPSSYAGSHALSLGTNYATTPNGTDWSVRSPYSELGIVVRAIPEPSAILLAIAALGILPTRRRKSVPQDRV